MVNSQRWHVEHSIKRFGSIWLAFISSAPARPWSAGRLPLHVEDLIVRPKVRRRVVVASDTPLHGQRRGLGRERHLVHAPMASAATHAPGDVHAMIEVNVGGQDVHFFPADRPVIGEAFAHRREHGRVRPNLGVAARADMRRRQARKRGFLNAGVAVQAMDAEFAKVMLVAERDRLLPDHILAGHIGRAHDAVSHADCGERKQSPAMRTARAITFALGRNSCMISRSAKGSAVPRLAGIKCFEGG